MESSFSAFREGLEWADIDWVDNGECLDLIEKVSSTVLTKRFSQNNSFAPCSTYLVSFTAVLRVLTQCFSPGAA